MSQPTQPSPFEPAPAPAPSGPFAPGPGPGPGLDLGPGTGPGPGLIQEPPAPYGAVPVAYGTAGGVLPSERNWALAAHLSGFVAASVALGFLGPLVVLFTEGSRSAFVRGHAVEALNFNLSVLIWAVISGILCFVLIGIPMLIGLGVLYLVTSIMGAMAASRGESFRYPLTIRFVS
jgi:uncharacterized protein